MPDQPLAECKERTMTIRIRRVTIWRYAVLASVVAVCTPQAELNAQGVGNETAIDTIIGSHVTTEETRAASDPAAIITAIKSTVPNTEEIRKRSNLSKVEIVFLEDLAEGREPKLVEKEVEKHEAEIAALREAIEGNAMFFYAIELALRSHPRRGSGRVRQGRSRQDLRRGQACRALGAGLAPRPQTAAPQGLRKGAAIPGVRFSPLVLGSRCRSASFYLTRRSGLDRRRQGTASASGRRSASPG